MQIAYYLLNFLTLNPTQPNPTRPDQTRPVVGPDPCPTLVNSTCFQFHRALTQHVGKHLSNFSGAPACEVKIDNRVHTYSVTGIEGNDQRYGVRT